MTRGTQLASPVIERVVDRFRRLVGVAVLSGAVAGLALFAVQHWAVAPLIATAETYETAAHQAMSGMAHEDEGWQPAPGIERTALTALSTMLSGVGFAAVLLAAMTLSGRPISARGGALWGLAGFTCFVLAPALGLPPAPPSAAVADLYPRQLWWLGTATATALGLWLLTDGAQRWAVRAAGLLSLALPHMIGAPTTRAVSLVPAELLHEFAAASVATTGVFWLLVGTLCGFVLSHLDARSHSGPRSARARPGAESEAP
jgi:cobalt transporter subunit CbtA